MLTPAITTQPDYRVHTSARLRLTLERAGETQIVIVRGKRWGHAGLLVESRRGQGGWEEIGIPGSGALRDTRPLARLWPARSAGIPGAVL